MCGRPMGGGSYDALTIHISGIDEWNVIADADGGVAIVERGARMKDAGHYLIASRAVEVRQSYTRSRSTHQGEVHGSAGLLISPVPAPLVVRSVRLISSFSTNAQHHRRQQVQRNRPPSHTVSTCKSPGHSTPSPPSPLAALRGALISQNRRSVCLPKRYCHIPPKI